MEDILIRITKPPRGPIIISSDWTVISSQGDQNSARLIFQRPIEYENDRMNLIVSDGVNTFEGITLGTENEFILTSAYTRRRRLVIALMFDRISGEIAHTNSIEFEIRGALSSGTSTPIEIQPPIYLGESVFTGAEFDNETRTLTLFNHLNKPVAAVVIPIEGVEVEEEEEENEPEVYP